MCSNELSLGFNAQQNQHQHPMSDLGMFVVAPATTSFHQTHPNNFHDPNYTLFSSNLNVGVTPLQAPAPVEDAAPANNSHVKSTWVAAGGATVTCRDCGNQAKKDCSHGRCRICCRNRRFDCSTHVSSTWVPAARRRERQIADTGSGGGASSGSTSSAKKPRIVASQNTCTAAATTSASNTPPRSFDATSSHQDVGLKETLPGQVRAPAVFKCVRVTAVDGGEDEFAYQAVVKIGGHLFKGFLYDQGADQSRVNGFPNLSELHLGGGGGGGGVGRVGRNGAYPLLDPSTAVYGGSSEGLLGGLSYGNTIN